MIKLVKVTVSSGSRKGINAGGNPYWELISEGLHLGRFHKTFLLNLFLGAVAAAQSWSLLSSWANQMFQAG